MEFSVTPDHCRVCLKRTPSGKYLRDKFALELPSTKTGTAAEARSCLDVYTYVAAVSSPSLEACFFPQRICENCEAQLLVAYEFRRKSVRSERVLVNILNFYEDEREVGAGVVPDTKAKVESVVEEPVVDCFESVAVSEEVKESVVEDLDSKTTAEKEQVGVELNFQQFEHDYEIVSEGGLDQEEEIGYIIEEEFMDDGEESESNEEDEFYEVQLAESKSKTSICPDCGKVVSARYLEKHREIHKDKCDRVKPFECDQCQARFTLKENLLKHKRIHSNEKNYSCPYCQEQFLHWASRRYHIDSRHTGEKRFTCEYCGAKFRNSSHYSVHLRRHKGLTPFPCHLCDRSFITGNSLKLHLASHSDRKNFACELCQKTYKTAKSLRIHQRTAHEREKNYVCPVCSRAYSQNHVLKTHLLRHHPHYEPPPPGTVINARAVRKMNEQLVAIGEKGC
uniref:C2h2-type zn-finger protein n=1 Tax=Culex tarsalis TaxID=7177 RepID=A0A1Q3F0X3_CULTA